MKHPSQHLRGRLGLMVVPYGVLAISLVMTVLSTFFATKELRAKEETEFESLVNATQEAINHRYKKYLDELVAVRAFYASHESLSTVEWEKYIKSMEVHRRYPGIYYLGISEMVPHEALASHTEKLRLRDPAYQIFPSADRPAYFPIVFLSEFESSQRPPLGIDPSVFPDRKLAMDRARDTGLPAMTGRVNVFPSGNTNTFPGFVIYLPVYHDGMPIDRVEDRRNSLRGFVVAAFSSERFFQGVGNKQAEGRIEFFLQDESQGGLLFQNDPGVDLQEAIANARLSRQVEIPLLNRTWLLQVLSTSQFAPPSGLFLGAVIGAGTLVSFVFFFIALLQVRARASAERMAMILQKSEDSLKQANEQLTQKMEQTRQTEIQLSFERDLLRALLDHSPDRIYFKDTRSRFIRCSAAHVKRLGMENESQVIGKGDFDFHPKDQAQEFFNDEQRIITTGQSLINKIEKQTDPNGNEIWASVTKVPIYNARGEISGIVGISRDMTLLKKAELALEHEKERLAVTLRCIGDGVITTDVRGTVVLLNKVAESLTGWSQEEAIGRPLTDVFKIISARNRQPSVNPVEKVLQTGETVGLENHTILISRSGEEREIADSASPIFDTDGNIIGVVLDIRDVTEETRREEELLKASKLESVGLLAGGIAHDFNNILTAIIGNLSLARMNSNSPEKLQGRLEQAEKAALRARDLTQQLLTFARGGAPIKKRVQLEDLIRESTEFVLHGANVSCEFRIPSDLWLVNVDEGQISQVIHNLVINAKQAMPEGGKIEVAAGNVKLVEGQVPPLPVGNYIRINIKDHGVGIAKENLNKIFDPYFTTKTQGNGLGLATAYSIVRKHDGVIQVHSTEGMGTSFEVYLPAFAKQVVQEIVKIAPQIQPAPGKGRILVMDDEFEIHSVATAILEMMGYEVEIARDGAEAIDLYLAARHEKKPFSVVIMDLTIPNGMGGKETVRRLKDVDPDVKAVVSSGYSYDPVMANYREFGFCGVVTKPYRAEDLGHVLHEILGGTDLRVSEESNGNGKSNGSAGNGASTFHEKKPTRFQVLPGC